MDPITVILLALWGLLALAILLQYGGMIDSLRAIDGAGAKLAIVAGVVAVLGLAAYRQLGYLTPEREGWIIQGRAPADTVSIGFNTKSRFRGLAQPIGRVLDRNGTLLADYEYHEHLRRAYPAGPATAHVVGYWTGPIRDGVGVEKALTYLNDSLHDDRPHDAHLSLDLRLQREAIRALNGRMGAVVVMDAANGQVLALADLPTYDPNVVWNDTAWKRIALDTVLRPLTSRAIKDNFSPGSSIKPFVAAAARDLSAPLPESRGFVCTGSYAPAPDIKPVSDHGSGHGRIDIFRAMRVSCNVYFSYLAYGLIGFDPLAAYLDSLGYNQRVRWNTGLFLNRSGGLIPAMSWVKARDEIARTRIGIGQASVKANPLHVATLLTGIANGGVFLAPTLELDRAPDTLHRQMSRATAQWVEQLLKEPLLPGGTAAAAFAGIGSRGLAIYGKTGTADPEPDGRDPSWFISYGRKNGRCIVVVVAIQNRQGQLAGSINAPIARRMYEALDSYGYFGASAPETPAGQSPAQAPSSEDNTFRRRRSQ